MRKLYLLTMASLILFSSCKRKELIYDYYNSTYCDVSVSLDWSVFDTREAYPSGASVWFYPTDGGSPTKAQSNNIYDISASLQEGLYNIVVFNQVPSDFGTINFRGTDTYSSLEAYGVDETTKGSWYTRSDEERIIRDPEDLASITYEGFEVSEDMVRASNEARSRLSVNTDTRSYISLKPEMVTNDGTVRIKIQGIEYLLEARGAITGFAEGQILSEPLPTSTNVTHVLENYTTTGSYGEGELIFTFSNFGVVSDIASSLVDGGEQVVDVDYSYWSAVLDLEILLVDNSTVLSFEIELDSDALVDISSDNSSIYIDIGNGEGSSDSDDFDPDSGITLPEVDSVGGSGGGFDATVDEWGDVEITEIPVL